MKNNEIHSYYNFNFCNRKYMCSTKSFKQRKDWIKKYYFQLWRYSN